MLIAVLLLLGLAQILTILSDRAMRIKEDVIDNLNLTHSTWQGEKKQRELLQDHIRSITELVKKLDRDIKVLQDQTRVKDSYLANTGTAIKTIELQQATVITDIRGRIARCDAAIAKLVSEQMTLQDGLKQTGARHQDAYQRLQEKIQTLEIKVREIHYYVSANMYYDDFGLCLS